MLETARPSAVLRAALIAAFAGVLAFAEEAPPAPAAPAEKPVVEEKAAPAVPAEQPAGKPAEVPKAEPPAPKTEKALASGVQPLIGLADAYQAAADGLRRWAREESDALAAADESVKKLQDQIQDNEATITRLKFENTRENRARAKELARDNKQLWRELESAKAERAGLARSLSKTAAQKVREYNVQAKEKLAEVQSQLQ